MTPPRTSRRWSAFNHRETQRELTPATQDVQITQVATCRGALEAKSPEATRTVAGGASASERPPDISVMSESTPAGVAEGFGMPSTHSATPPGSELELHMDTGGRSLRSHHRLPYEPPPAALSMPESSRAAKTLGEVVQRTQRTQSFFFTVLCVFSVFSVSLW